MQVDMHYFGTYTLARTAGLLPHFARIVATSSQFVDDNVDDIAIEFSDGGQVRCSASGHHGHYIENISPHDQRTIWVPFHFLPGGEGETFTQRLMCKKNSPILQEMLEHHLTLSHTPYAPFLLGIAAHVLFDSYAHYNFSGVSSRTNHVQQDTIKILEPHHSQAALDEHRNNFFERFTHDTPNIRTNVEGELPAGALGHGTVCNYPDTPFLTWSYQPETTEPKTIRRSNTDDYMEAAEHLYTYFVRFAELRPDLTDASPVPFEDIMPTISVMLMTPGTKHERSGLWQVAMAQGAFLQGTDEEIPPYAGDMWKRKQQELATCPDCAFITDMDIYKFHQAAEVHRAYILTELLPAHDILV